VENQLGKSLEKEKFMTPKHYFREAQSKVRESLRASPAVLAAVMAAALLAPAQDANAYEFEHLGKTIGDAVGSAMNNGKPTWGNPNAQAANEVSRVIFGRMGRNMDSAEREEKRQAAEDARIIEQARRDALYEAARRKESERLGIPYGDLQRRGVSNASQFAPRSDSQSYLDRQPHVWR
jgi:hypothetical protein